MWLTTSSLFTTYQAALEAPDYLTREEALALASTNLEKLLGVKVGNTDCDLVATEGGGLLDIEGKVDKKAKNVKESNFYEKCIIQNQNYNQKNWKTKTMKNQIKTKTLTETKTFWNHIRFTLHHC